MSTIADKELVKHILEETAFLLLLNGLVSL